MNTGPFPFIPALEQGQLREASRSLSSSKVTEPQDCRVNRGVGVSPLVQEGGSLTLSLGRALPFSITDPRLFSLSLYTSTDRDLTTSFWNRLDSSNCYKGLHLPPRNFHPPVRALPTGPQKIPRVQNFLTSAPEILSSIWGVSGSEDRRASRGRACSERTRMGEGGLCLCIPH